PERGLVQRQRSDHDRRAVTLRATRAGERLLDQLFPGHARRVRDAFTPLDDDEKRALGRLCRNVDPAARAGAPPELERPLSSLPLPNSLRDLWAYSPINPSMDERPLEH